MGFTEHAALDRLDHFGEARKAIPFLLKQLGARRRARGLARRGSRRSRRAPRAPMRDARVADALVAAGLSAKRRWRGHGARAVRRDADGFCASRSSATRSRTAGACSPTRRSRARSSCAAATTARASSDDGVSSSKFAAMLAGEAARSRARRAAAADDDDDPFAAAVHAQRAERREGGAGARARALGSATPATRSCASSLTTSTSTARR